MLDDPYLPQELLVMVQSRRLVRRRSRSYLEQAAALAVLADAYANAEEEPELPEQAAALESLLAEFEQEETEEDLELRIEEDAPWGHAEMDTAPPSEPLRGEEAAAAEEKASQQACKPEEDAGDGGGEEVPIMVQWRRFNQMMAANLGVSRRKIEEAQGYAKKRRGGKPRRR